MIDFSGRLQGHAAPIPVASVVVLDYFMPCLCLVSSVFAILFMAVLFLDQPKNRTKANAILGAPSFLLRLPSTIEEGKSKLFLVSLR